MQRTSPLLEKIPFLLHPRKLALEASQLLVRRCPGATESNRSRALRLTLAAGQQRVANPQFPGHLGTADARLAGLLNRATPELGTELPAL